MLLFISERLCVGKGGRSKPAMVKTCNSLEGIKHEDAAGRMHNAWTDVYALL